MGSIFLDEFKQITDIGEQKMENITEKHHEHVIGQINTKIKKHEASVLQLKQVIQELNKTFYNLGDFKCPMGTTEDAICPQCPEAIPVIVYGWDGEKSYNHHVWPPNYKEDLKDISRTAGCLEWKKKKIFTACGCGGNMDCVCGYSEGFCFLPSETVSCPFCGRTITVPKTPTVLIKSLEMKNRSLLKG